MTGHLAGRSRGWAAGLVLCAVAAAATYFWLARPDQAVLPPSTPGSDGTSREDAAVELLEDLSAALSSGRRDDVVSLAAPGDRDARRELRDVAANVRTLGIRDVSMRYVDEESGRGSTTTAGPRGGPRSWVVDVQIGWRLDDFDRSGSGMEVTLELRETRAGAAYVSARRDYGKAAPLWLLDRLAVERSRRALVMVARDGPDSPAQEFARLADRAVRDVRRVLPRWRGKLVVEVPADQQQLERTLSAEDGAYGAIAAVTTPVDGSLASDAPVHIFVNPLVFEPLGARGAQIVMSHEATHVATDASASSVPTWLLEGFADYVALAHVDLPVQVTASQILEQVRSDGPPGDLPGPDEFKSRNTALGASYEAAWLACRLLAEKYGEKALIEFYDTAGEDGDTRAAFRGVFGTTQTDFTEDWRRSLRRLAG